MTIKVSKNRIDFGTTGMKNYAESVNALGNVTGVTTIDYSLGSVVTATVTGTVTWSITNPPASGKTGSLTLILTNGGVGAQTWPSGTKWSWDSAPVLIASGVDVLTFMTIDGGTSWTAVFGMNNSK
jgi:hypothetical protein